MHKKPKKKHTLTVDTTVLNKIILIRRDQVYVVQLEYRFPLYSLAYICTYRLREDENTLTFCFEGKVK